VYTRFLFLGGTAGDRRFDVVVQIYADFG